MSILEIEGLTYSYLKKEEPIIKDFSFSMEKGEVVGILGRSGSGKSTLLRLIAGLEMPLKGSIKVAGTTVVSDCVYLHPEEREVGMVFQDYALFPHLTVKNNILFGLSRMPRNERKQRVEEMLELVQLESFSNRYPHELSGGQQQRVALARALAPKPNLLLMDEPFSNLDADLRETIREELKVILKTANMTCIMVTHDRKDVEAICDRSVVFDLAHSKNNNNK
ncbi:ABC transporter ATP-binding protein [Ureibacillus composti]